MNVTVKELPKGQVELSVELSPDDMRPYLERAATSISSSSNIPGFRPGKAPYDVVVKRVGEMRVYQDAAERAVEKTYSQAVIDHKLQTVGSPQIAVEKIAPGNPFSYRAVASLVPTVEIADYKNIKEQKRTPVVEPKETDDAIQNLRKLLAKEKRVQRPVQNGDKIEADLATFLDSVPLDGGATKNQSLMLGEGRFVPGFEEQLIGLSEGQTKEFSVKFPKEYHRKDMANRPVEFKVTVNAVFERELPPADDAFAQQVGKFEKLDDLRKKIEGNILQEKQEKEGERWELAVLDAIIKKSTFGPIPDMLLEAEAHKMMHELEHDVSSQGMKFEDYLTSIKKTKESLEKELAPRAVERIKAALILRHVAERENITARDEEITREIDKAREQYHDQPDILKQITSDDYRSYLRTNIRSRKVMEFFHSIADGKK
ncbi:MAG: trigger factor [Patescibacteria group bacterium]|nr:trigger factor [Patescibacteria group bacterium]MDD5715574.1 trigger factor [Patescibacteria group bacterium]